MAGKLRVVRSCGEDWETMTPGARGRHCGACDRVVLDLRGMTRREAEARYRAVVRDEGRACGRATLDLETGELAFARPPRGTGGRALARGALVAAALATGCGSSRVAVPPSEPSARLVPLTSPKPVGPETAPPAPDAGTPPEPGDGGGREDAGATGRPPHAQRHPRHGHGLPPQRHVEIMGDMAM